MSYATQIDVQPPPLHSSFLPPHTTSSQTDDSGARNQHDSSSNPNRDYFSVLVSLRQAALSTIHRIEPPLRQDSAIWNPSPSSAIYPTTAAESFRTDSAVLSAPVPDWMYATAGDSMGGSTQGAQEQRSYGLKRQRLDHQRTPSVSTVASTGPSSPHHQNTSYPHIANTDYSPDSPAPFPDSSQAYAKTLARHIGSQDQGDYATSPPFVISSDADNAHMAMKGFAIDHHHADELPPDFSHSAHSMSSNGYNSPATPHSASDNDGGGGGSRDEMSKMHQQQQQSMGFGNPNPSLIRTESAAYQDELYNPANFTSAPTPASKPSKHYLSPHRNLINERINTLNIARSESPSSTVSRERSPFRHGSPLAPLDSWTTPATGRMNTAANMRRQQKEQAEQAEYAQHRPSLQREPTKTISPKDAILDYNGADEPSLFQDNVPAGYKQHFGGAEVYANDLFSQPGAAFGGLSMPSQQGLTSFRGGNNFNFSPQPVPQPAMGQSNPFASDAYQSANLNSYQTPMVAEPTPEFPANLTSMDSSVSENTAHFLSSQETAAHPAPTRPADTRANTGTYTCTYHGCTQRFDSPGNLQKHKREFHRSQAHQSRSDASTDNTTSSPSPRSTASPAPSGSGMSSAAILARNSQAGPHKCTRTNPSTGKPCNTIFSRPYDLTRHEDTIHNNRKQKVRCPMCREEKTFSRTDALTRHMRVVHPEVEAFAKRGRRGD